MNPFSAFHSKPDRPNRWAVALTFSLSLITGCTSTSQPVVEAALGQTSSSSKLRATLTTPGPIVLEKVLAARWMIDRAGLINLKHEHAIEAGLTSGEEPIEIYFYRVTHPEFGSFLIDSGIARSFKKPSAIPQVSWIVKKVMNTTALEPATSTGDWLEQTGIKLSGVFLTHIHLDHIFGMPDIPANVPVYTGPGETEVRSLQNAFTQGTTDRLLANVKTLHEWQFESDPDEALAGVIDIFGDGSLWALHVPGHTPGSTAFVARTATGPHLITGDASHTTWGWNNGVEPGTFSLDIERSRESLAALKALEADYESLSVHPGHQRKTQGLDQASN